MDFARDVSQGLGPDWRGTLFRKRYKDLRNIISDSKVLFPSLFRGAQFNSADYVWKFPDGEELYLMYMARHDDVQGQVGQQWPWVGWDEITMWADSFCYTSLLGSCRSANPKVRARYRSTTNAWGPGFGWVKDRFQLYSPRNDRQPIQEPGAKRVRIAILGRRAENRALMESDGGAYDAEMLGIKDEALRAAWGEDWGWDSPAGGFFEGSWTYADAETGERHYPCIIPTVRTPDEWLIHRCLDWGDVRPFSVLWIAIADGVNEAVLPGGHKWCPPAGSRVMVAEWYGMKKGEPNMGLGLPSPAVAEGILRREREWGIWYRVVPGPADGIWGGSTPDPGEQTIAKKMARVESPVPKDARVGAHFVKPRKYRGSRVDGWRLMRESMEIAHEDEPESPGFWVMDCCEHFIRCVAAAPRSEKDPDDVDTECEDHCLDAARYLFLEIKGGRAATSIEEPMDAEALRSYGAKVAEMAQKF